MNSLAKGKNTVNPINKLTVVTFTVIYILGRATADASEIAIEFFRNLFWRRNAMIVNLDFPNIIRSLFTSENIINSFPSLVRVTCPCRDRNVVELHAPTRRLLTLKTFQNHRKIMVLELLKSKSK